MSIHVKSFRLVVDCNYDYLNLKLHTQTFVNQNLIGGFSLRSITVYYVWGLQQPYFSKIRKYPYTTFHLEIQQ